MENSVEKISSEDQGTTEAKPDMNVYLTPAAVTEVKRRLQSDPEGNRKMLRLRVQAGGCSGLSYDMDFVSERSQTDREFEFDGLKVVVDARSLLYIAGMTLDYSERLVNGGFVFTNPRAKRSCGCGTSFSV